jgi:hypothetical protein
MFLFLVVGVQIRHVITENMQYSYTLKKFHTQFYSNNMERDGHLHAPVLCILDSTDSIKKPDITDKTMWSTVGKNTFDISNNLLIKLHNHLDHLPVDEIILKFRSCIIVRQYTFQAA